jgi:hypothetical protein
MGLAVIAVVFVASLFGVPTLFNHGDSHTQEHAQEQQVASVQTPAPEVSATAEPAATEHP